MAPLCARAFPVRESANRTPWSGRKPEPERSFRLIDLLRNARYGRLQDNDQEDSV
jgi:hypothetical protein